MVKVSQQLIQTPGVYKTKSGEIALVTKTDGYRRAEGYLAEKPHQHMSWYTEDGAVRHGMACGPDFDNDIATFVSLDLPPRAHERGKEAQRLAREKHMKAIRDRQRYTPERARELEVENAQLKARIRQLEKKD